MSRPARGQSPWLGFRARIGLDGTAKVQWLVRVISYFIVTSQTRSSMVHVIIGLISFAAIFGGALTGLFARRRLPGHHLSGETQSVVTVSVADLRGQHLLFQTFG
ncbi:MAG: hypothetical protein DMF40_15955 [Verrucomicrobia bacterium]|nr:MAG: hypothetical protein DMF40_15955 [Verrucomicrobiota bacterium]